jgi:hypothetical protein
MLLIVHSSPNKIGVARTCIPGWVLKDLRHAAPNGKLEVTGAIKSQTDEILYDPDGELTEDEAINVWIRDYCAKYNGVVAFSYDNVIELDMNQNNTAYEATPMSTKEYNVFVFASSYGGDGMKMKMHLSEGSAKLWGII